MCIKVDAQLKKKLSAEKVIRVKNYHTIITAKIISLIFNCAYDSVKRPSSRAFSVAVLF